MVDATNVRGGSTAFLVGMCDMVGREWKAIQTAPFDQLIEVAVIDHDGVHAFIFPVRRLAGGWLADGIKGRIDIDPTHWREMAEERAACLYAISRSLRP